VHGRCPVGVEFVGDPAEALAGGALDADALDDLRRHERRAAGRSRRLDGPYPAPVPSSSPQFEPLRRTKAFSSSLIGRA
jgi:hypothetical protein